MKNRDGKTLLIVILLVLILGLGVVPWFFVVSRFLTGWELPDYTPPPAEDVSPDLNDANGDDDPDDLNDPDDNGDDDPDDIFDPRDDIVTSISVTHPDINRELRAIANNFGAVAVSLVAIDGELGVYHTYEYGYADVQQNRRIDMDTKYRIASLSKLLTVICAMTLVDNDFLDLDTDISTYLGFEVRNQHFPDMQITARMLMQHTSSIFDSNMFIESRDRDSTESVRYVIDNGMTFRRSQPGSVFEYSNFGYAILGALCERIYGTSLDTMAREVIFDPMGIDAAYVPRNLYDTSNIAIIYSDDHTVSRSVQAQLDVKESSTLGHDLHLAQGNLTISALDYARILMMLFDNGVSNSVRILSENSVKEIHIASVEGNGYRQGLGTRYSVGEFIPDEGLYWHTGSSFGIFSQFIYDIEEKRGVIIITSGASIERQHSGKIDICTDMSLEAWLIFELE
ncbi:MAG: beta-lactamase family protein [Oscillospiraceae bacterium]|jgi:CubicO group peptidase (beta-lactamase class C family)|nr:beta-lactamase family protein [Oscillospiraceae bacterium]